MVEVKQSIDHSKPAGSSGKVAEGVPLIDISKLLEIPLD